jgi:nuclear pore complex protein Nup88
VFNRTGRSLAIAGDNGLVVVDLVPHLSAPSNSSGSVTVCRPSKVGGGKFFSKKSWNALRILQVEWHPYSDTHLGILSTDGVLRLFDLSLDIEEAEQEYHLQAELLVQDRTLLRQLLALPSVVNIFGIGLLSHFT